VLALLLAETLEEIKVRVIFVLDKQRGDAVFLSSLIKVFLNKLTICLLWADEAGQTERCDVVPAHLNVWLLELETNKVAQVDVYLSDHLLRRIA